MIGAMRLLVALMVVAMTAPSEAQGKSKADELFDEGRALMARNDFAKACPKFEESMQLDPALGTFFNIALCVEGSGKVARALGLWRQAEAKAKAAGEGKRASTAREHIVALEARVPTIAIRVASDVPGLRVMIDGQVADLAQPTAVEPGEIAITASADGREPFATQVTVREHDRAVVVVPALAETAKEAPSAPTGSGEATPQRRPLAYGLAGGGVAAVGVGVILGLTAKSSYDRAFHDGHCDRATLVCDDAGQAATDRARTRGTIGTVIGAVGLAAIAAGVIVYVTAPVARDTAIVPTASDEGAGLALIGRF